MPPVSSQEDTPVAIVGGGPAGLAAAIALAQAGVSVVVLERGSWPRDKVCGEGVMPTGVAVLDRLGVLPLIAPEQCRPFRGIDWLNVAGAGVGGDFAQGAGLAIRRTGLSDALVRRAEQLDGIALWARACVQDVRLQPDGMVLSITQGGASRTLRAQVVVAADGRHSPIRKRFGLDGPPSVSMQRWGARQHFEMAPWSDRVEVWWGPGVEAYVTPSGESQVGVAFLWDEARFTPPAKGVDMVEGLLESFPVLAERLACGLDSPLSSVACLGPLAVAARCCSADRLLLLGDAVGYVDGITGEGLSAGLAQAETIAQMLPQHLADGQLDAASLRPLGERVQGLFLDTVALARAALVLSRYPLLWRLVVRGLSRASGFFTHLLELNMGRTRWYRLRPMQLLCFIVGLMTPSPRTTYRR